MSSGSGKSALEVGGIQGMSTHKEEEARRHIAEIAETHRTTRGKSEYVSLPGPRRFGRKVRLAWTWACSLFVAVGRRAKEPNKPPGRWWSRLKLLRPSKTFSPWSALWLLVVVVAGFVGFFFFGRVAKLVTNEHGSDLVGVEETVKWIARTVLAFFFTVLVAQLWHDAIKSPYYVRRARKRVRSDPELLRQPTLSKRSARVLELEPPVNTVPRGDLYEELLPGAVSRERDVQIVMGVPGAGKTTALLDLATVLTKIGMMPVLLEMRGEKAPDSLFDKARERFEKQVQPLVRTKGDAEILWKWMCDRKRVAILVDDIDQITFDGEPGFAMRRVLENLADEGQTTIVTARPAGVPVGITASAFTMDELDFDTAVDIVVKPASREPGAPVTASGESVRDRIERWVKDGRLTESPLYLEALAEMNASGVCPDLPDNPGRWEHQERPGRWREMSERRREWSQLWVRYLLLSRFYERMVSGVVRRSLGIDSPDRKRSLRALEGAALGMLGASGLAARSDAKFAEQPKESRPWRPKRSKLVEFVSSDDRRDFEAKQIDSKVVRRRREVSQHEAVDAGERLRVLDRDWKGNPQFRHRIMQAYLAGRRLAELGRLEQEEVLQGGEGRSKEHVDSFEGWVETLIDSHHPEKLTAHLALTFAAIHADEASIHDTPPRRSSWDGLAVRIVEQILATVKDRDKADVAVALLIAVDRNAAGSADLHAAGVAVSSPHHENPDAEMAEELDPMRSRDPGDRYDYDDDLIKLTTAANILGVIRPDDRDPGHERNRTLAKEALAKIGKNDGATRWTKLEALGAIPNLECEEGWKVIWGHFTTDLDYDVRRKAGHELERNACRAYPKLRNAIQGQLLSAGARAAEGQEIQIGSPNGHSGDGDAGSGSLRTFMTLGWVLPPIVSGLSEELRVEGGTGRDPAWEQIAEVPGSVRVEEDGDRIETPEDCLKCARRQLEEFVTLAYEGGHHELEESLAQGFKADAWRHASDPSRGFTGPGWVVNNRRLVADVALPNAESWYARMLLHQALALYAVAGTHVDDTLDVTAYRLHLTRERHPFVRRAAKLARKAIFYGRLGKAHWSAFIWTDDVEDGGRLPSVLSRRTAQLVGDVAVLVDLKEGSPPDRHGSFSHMEELPYCLRASRDRYEILGKGCPAECGWDFCPYRAASPDEPNEHRGVGRGFCRAQRRAAKRSPAWQRGISKRKLREFWKQMEYKARR